MADKCERCDGCGQIANDDDGSPWSEWISLPPQARAAVTMGLVKPLPCPVCAGTGKAAEGPEDGADEWQGTDADVDEAARLADEDEAMAKHAEAATGAADGTPTACATCAALRQQLQQTQAYLASEQQAYREEVDEFNAGFEAAKRGEPCDEPFDIKHDRWRAGWVWYYADRVERNVKAEAALVALRRKVKALQAELDARSGWWTCVTCLTTFSPDTPNLGHDCDLCQGCASELAEEDAAGQKAGR